MRGRSLPLLLLVTALALGAGKPSAGRAGDQIVLSGSVDVSRSDRVGDVVIFHGSAKIDGTAEGDVVVLDGAITVAGTVRGDVVALDGSVTLVEGAHVTGDVWVPHGDARIDVGAKIDGSLERRTPLGFLAPARLIRKLSVWIAISVSTLALGLLMLLLAPRGADAVFEALRRRPGASVAWGVGAFLGLPVVAVLALVTLVGIPFGLGLLLALGFLYSVGYAWSAWVVGRVLIRPGRHGLSRRRYPAFLVGWAILRAVGFVPVLGAITWVAGAAFGLGLMTVATWRARKGPLPPALTGPVPPRTVFVPPPEERVPPSP
jgi:hypothetical protein